MSENRTNWTETLKFLGEVIAVGGVVLTALWGGIRFGVRWSLAIVRGVRLSDRLHARHNDPLQAFDSAVLGNRIKVAELDRVLLLVLDHCDIAAWICDKEGKIVAVTPAICSLFGLDSSEMLGHGWTRALADGGSDALAKWKIAIETGADYVAHYKVYRNGDMIKCESEAWPIKVDGQIVEFVGVVRRVV